MRQCTRMSPTPSAQIYDYHNAYVRGGVRALLRRSTAAAGVGGHGHQRCGQKNEAGCMFRRGHPKQVLGIYMEAGNAAWFFFTK